MRSVLTFIAVAFAAFLSPQFADAQSPSCHIGKPSYCFKYGGSICQKSNPKGKASCDAWAGACIDCDSAIAECLDHKRPPTDSAQCRSCAAAWSRCMDRIDKRFWPNRMSG